MSDDEKKNYPIPLRTHTSLWQVEKRLYKLYDFTLPTPISIKQLGFFLGFSIPWWAILSLVGLPFASPWHLVWLAPPVAVTFFAARPVAEGKRLGELAWSQIIYLLQPKKMTHMEANNEPDVWHVVGKVWRQNGQPPIGDPDFDARPPVVPPH